MQEISQITPQTGTILTVNGPLVTVSDLVDAFPYEMVEFEGGQKGLILSLLEAHAEVLLLTDTLIKSGEGVKTLGIQPSILPDEKLLGDILSPLDLLITTNTQTGSKKPYLVFAPAPGIETRVRISQPLYTGVRIVDLLLPLGAGQRELVIGERKTGKTQFLLTTLTHQAKKGTVCIYAAVGKRSADITSIYRTITSEKVLERTILLASSSSDPVGSIFLTPYIAMSIAEYFRDEGHDVLLILDDMTTHAKYYREIALTQRRFPGRNAYPTDIFYMHAQLLERAGHMAGGTNTQSITCLPVAEVTEHDLSGYIPTNLMSMTDGHLFFDKNLFLNGQFPAVNPFLSVTRVGRQTQSALQHDITRTVTSFLAKYNKLQSFTHFSQELSSQIREDLARGQRLTNFFTQRTTLHIPLSLDIFLLALVWMNVVPGKTPAEFHTALQAILSRLGKNEALEVEILKLVASAKTFDALMSAITKNKAKIEPLLS